MIRFDQEEFDGLVESLRHQPGFITAAVVPAGSGGALIDRLRDALGDLEIEIAAGGNRPVALGARAAALGQSRAAHVFILKLDDPERFDSEADEVRFWRELNYQREALASGTVRTCLILSEVTERGLALVADDLWDWTTIFRFPEATLAAVRTPADSEALVWSDRDGAAQPSEAELTTLRSQWQRARQAGLPPATLVENYAVPLFLALPSKDGEARQLWQHHLRSEGAIEKLPPETSLLVASKLMDLARQGELRYREDQIRAALVAGDAAVATLERKAAARPEAFEPGLAAALSTAAKLHQDAGRFERASSLIERSLALLQRLPAVEGGESKALIASHLQRRWTLELLLRARENHALPPLEQVERLQALREPSLEGDLWSNALGTALEIAITQPDNPLSQATAPLFTAWLLSHDAYLVGPRFEEVLAHDPVSYCRGIETLWRITTHSPWERLLIAPLIQQWATNGPACDAIHQELVGWLLHFLASERTSDGEEREEERQRSRTGLQWIAIKVLGYRYEPTLLRVFCRYLVSFSELGEAPPILRYRATLHLGFMLRWSYQERVLQPLQEIGDDPKSASAEREAARDLANELWQAGLPRSLRREANSRPMPRSESVADQLKRGQRGLLQRLSLKEFCEQGPHLGIAELAGDPRVPDLSREDQRALVDQLRALIGTGRVRKDNDLPSYQDQVMDTWIPWLARCSPLDWWKINTELIEQQIDLPKPQWALMRFPVLGVWPQDQIIARKIEEKIQAATEPDGEKLRENFGLLELLRWALHLKDSEAQLRCLEALTKEKEYADVCRLLPVPRVLRWSLDQVVFEAAGQRRRAATQDIERRLWFLVEWPFIDRLAPEEALSWCKEVASLAIRWDDLRWILVDQLTRIDVPGAMELLLGEDGVADPQDQETQRKILSHASWRQQIDVLAERYSSFVTGLTLFNRGIYLAEAERTGELRQWGHDLFSKIVKSLPLEVSTDDHVAFTWSRRALHRWARLEPTAFLDAAEKIIAAADASRFAGDHAAALVEAILIVWQELQPQKIAEIRAELESGSMVRHTWSQNQIPLYIHALWDPEFSGRPEHRTLRLQWLRSCSSDKDIAQHALAARVNGMLPEVEAVGKILLSDDRQLERVLGVSLLAWHPDGEQWLAPLVEHDPSNWVRGHAQWAHAACRRDRIGRRLYIEALRAASWLEQQARFEQLVPLILPTFAHWHARDEEIQELTRRLAPRRRALLIDFRYHLKRKNHWRRALGRNLEKYCRGEDVSTHLELGEKAPPWLLPVHLT